MTLQRDGHYLCPQCQQPGMPIGVRAAMAITLRLRCRDCDHIWDVTHRLSAGSLALEAPSLGS